MMPSPIPQNADFGRALDQACQTQNGQNDDDNANDVKNTTHDRSFIYSTCEGSTLRCSERFRLAHFAVTALSSRSSRYSASIVNATPIRIIPPGAPLPNSISHTITHDGVR